MATRRSESNGDPPGRRDGVPLREATEDAVRAFTALVDKPAYGVTGVRKTDDGWSVLVDVVELERIPQSTNLLATYRVDVDERGQLLSYERLRRFTLGAADPT
ncbi:MAG TPA: gas vesicle protein [Pseudonocardiaceae bacterium]|jgi:hypothetical protein|nr:gas vesicle protein [Pseudonocardiaceae bacterium]